MAFSIANLFYQSPERDKENNRHREEVLKRKAERYEARAELVRARKGTSGPEDDGGPREPAPMGNFNVQAAIDSGGEDENMLQDWIEENPALTVVGAMGLGLGLAKLLKVF
jgi:hypothetical protein